MIVCVSLSLTLALLASLSLYLSLSLSLSSHVPSAFTLGRKVEKSKLMGRLTGDKIGMPAEDPLLVVGHFLTEGNGTRGILHLV